MFERLSPETINEVARYLDEPSQTSFRSKCEGADMQTFQTEVERVISTWNTSLIRRHTDILEAISKNEHIRRHVKTIRIADDCEANDPWNTSEPLLSEDIWVRDESGDVVTSEIGLENLRTILAEKRLLPEKIVVREYRISRENIRACSQETTRHQDYRTAMQTESNPGPAASLTRAIVEGLDLAVYSVNMQHASLPLSEHSILSSTNCLPGTSICSPHITEVTIKISPEDSSQGKGFPSLRNAELKVGGWWLEQMLYQAPQLEDLDISRVDSWDTLLTAEPPIPRLKNLFITWSTIPADALLHLIGNSSQSLISISLSGITLTKGSNWRDLLPRLADILPNLTYFKVMFPREETGGSNGISFLGFDEDCLPEECHSGLRLFEKGPANQRRLTKVVYEGPRAGQVMRQLAAYAAPLKMNRQAETLVFT